MDVRIYGILYWIQTIEHFHEIKNDLFFKGKSNIKKQIYFEDSICTFIYLLLLSVLS